MPTNPELNWERLTPEDKEKVVNSYMGIQNPKLKEDIEHLFGYNNITSYIKEKFSYITTKHYF